MHNFAKLPMPLVSLQRRISQGIYRLLVRSPSRRWDCEAESTEKVEDLPGEKDGACIINKGIVGLKARRK